MKVAITGPHFWPYRRRGSASYIHNLAKHLAEVGHTVDVITGKPGKSRIIKKGPIKYFYLPYLINPFLNRLKVDRVHMFALNCLRHFLKNKYDVVHCMYHPDGFIMNHLRRIKNIKYAQMITTVPFEFHWKHSPIDPYMFEKATRGANVRIAISHYAQNHMIKNNNLECECIPCGVDLVHFHPCKTKDHDFPKIICTAALHDERKKIPLLVKAFEMLLHNGIPAVLQLAAETTPDTTRHLRSLVGSEVINSIQILPEVTYRELPEYYSEASVTVLSSVNETFGIVMIESLACGTPVVGTNSGAIPEVINNPQIGCLFDINEKSETESILNLYIALRKALELSKDTASIERCRRHACLYDWKKIAAQITSLYERIVFKN